MTGKVGALKGADPLFTRTSGSLQKLVGVLKDQHYARCGMDPETGANKWTIVSHCNVEGNPQGRILISIEFDEVAQPKASQ